MTRPTISEPPFLVYVMWHPDSEDAGQVAEAIRNKFLSPNFRHVTGSTSIEVLFHCARQPGSPPFEMAWTASCPIAIVVLVDRPFVNDPKWVPYLRAIEEKADSQGIQTRIIPVTMDSSVLQCISLDKQAFRWDRCDNDIVQRTRLLLRKLSYVFATMLRDFLSISSSFEAELPIIERQLQKVQVFLSHSKHDQHGADIANALRCWIHEHSDLDSFLDVYDIPVGLNFPQVIQYRVKKSIMLVIYTDSYSSREWCRQEVVLAKQNDVSMVVADCLNEGDERALPYLGNVPVVRMSAIRRDRIPSIVARLLDEYLRHNLWTVTVNRLQDGHPRIIYLSRHPELISLAERGLDPTRSGTIVHPDPPLSKVEKELIGTVLGNFKLMSLNQWLACDRRNNDC